MNMIAMFIIMGLGGMILGLVAGYFTGGTMGMVAGLFAGFMPFMAIMQIIGYIRQKGFLALFKTLEENEKYVWVPNKLNKIKLFIFKIQHPGVIFKKGLGVFEDKGTEFSIGNSPMSFAYPDSGYGVDFKTEHYFSLLKRNEELEDFDDCVRMYLGEDKYKQFIHKFRSDSNAKPDYYNISNELEWLIRNKPGKDGDPLEQQVFGETVDFRSRLKYLRYNYNPVSSENATERERLIALKEGMDYREPDRYASKAKAIVMILFAVMVVIITLSVVDVGSLFGG